MNKSAYYLLTGGEVLERAKKHRTAHIRLMGELFDVAKQFGSTEIRLDHEMMLLHGVFFDGDSPSGWTKPCKKFGLARPKKLKCNEELLKKFTPSYPYSSKTRPQLAEFEVCVWHKEGHRVTLKAGKLVQVDCDELVVNAAVRVALNTPLVQCSDKITAPVIEAATSLKAAGDEVVDHVHGGVARSNLNTNPL